MDTTGAPSKREVGDLLLEQGKLTDKQLEAARRRQRRLHVPQHTAILHLNFVSEEDAYRALASLYHLEFVDVAAAPLTPTILELVPIKVIFNHRVVPLELRGEEILLAFAEPPRQAELGNLRLLLSRRFQPVLTTPSSLHAVIKKHFGLGAETIQRLRDDRPANEPAVEAMFDVKQGEPGAMDASIANFVDQVLREALRLQATDIHLEPYAGRLKLRYRIDGVLQEVPVPKGLHAFHPSIISRLKVMAGLNIAERRVPHDGRIGMKADDEEYDLRVSVIPTKYGEAVCLRVLGRQSLLLEFTQLGMDPDQEALIKELTELPQGMVLLTGPTGSGKTTTLYTALSHANDEGRKIITIEDPVEYSLEGVVQIQTRDEVGLSFASGLRSVLRHDPDVVLIGEIRDTETAEIAIRAAQTGHMVFSTLHTNDSLSAVTRLIDMGIDPFLIGASLSCSIAQRLAQRICRHCIEPDPAIPDPLLEEMAAATRIPAQDLRASRGRGCVECGQRGYRGRVAIYEFFVMNEEISDLLGPDLKTGNLRQAARRSGWRSLRENSWSKVHAGLITHAEVQRLTRRLQQPRYA